MFRVYKSAIICLANEVQSWKYDTVNGTNKLDNIKIV